jgi:hypothetical protein
MGVAGAKHYRWSHLDGEHEERTKYVALLEIQPVVSGETAIRIHIVNDRKEKKNMSMGGPGDHPITDLVKYGNNQFPPDIAGMIILLYSLNPNTRNTFALDAYDWVAGHTLEDGRAKLQAEIQKCQSHSG